VFATTLETKFSDLLKAHYHQLLNSQENTLREEFPLIKDPKKYKQMLENFDVAMQKLVKRYYVDEMERQLHQVYETWDSFPPAEAPKPGQDNAETLLTSELFEMLRFKLANTQGNPLR
jgi:hypothetical protein